MTGGTRTGDKRVVLVAAVAENGVIGKDGDLPWHLPEDLKHFRAVTRGHTVVMGRVTYDSIGRPLPERTNIVVTRDPDWADPDHPEVRRAGSLPEALALAEEYDGEVRVIGGAQVYAAALPHADAQVLSEVHGTPEGDTRYPDFDRAEWTETSREPREGFDVVWLERR